ncbi:MAG: nitrate/nitrite transporter NrtS [Geminicoccaceae bacterium]
MQVALIVGVILNLINQGDALIAGADVNLLKVALTFIVPYCVATYGAVSFQIAALKAETYVPFLASGGSPLDGAKSTRKDQQRSDQSHSDL